MKNRKRKKIIALPYFKDGKRILIPGAFNYGDGSFDLETRRHLIPITCDKASKMIREVKEYSIAGNQVTNIKEYSEKINWAIECYEN